MIKERYVSFKTSKLLKEKGFEWYRLQFNYIKTGETVSKEDLKGSWLGNAQSPFGNTCYNEEGKEIIPKYYNPNNPHYPRPTLAMANEWILEHGKMFVKIESNLVGKDRAITSTPVWYWEVADLKNKVLMSLNFLNGFEYWYNAMDEGLQEALKLM
jgi:hypothetical protein